MSQIKTAISHVRINCAFSKIILIGFACLTFILTGFGQQTFVGVHGKLSVKGNKIVDKNGEPIVLHGMSLYPWASQGTQFYNASAINHLVQEIPRTKSTN